MSPKEIRVGRHPPGRKTTASPEAALNEVPVNLPKPKQGNYLLFTACGNCKLWWVNEEDPGDTSSLKSAIRMGALVSVRCPRCHDIASHGYDKLPDHVGRQGGYRYVSTEEEKEHRAAEEARRTPPRALEPNEFFCTGCRAIHKKSKEVQDKLNAGKWLRIDCSCGNKIQLYGEVP